MKTLSEMKKDPSDKKIILKVKVIKKIKESTFIIADSTDCMLLSTYGNLRWSNFIQQDMFLQLIKPKMSSNYIIPTVSPVSIESFTIKHKNKKCCEDLEKIAFTEDFNRPPQSEPTSNMLLADVEALPAKTRINNILLKVANVSREIPGRYNSFRHITVKDISGDKSTVTLFGYFKDMITEGQVYKFNNLQTSDYKGPLDVYKRLNSAASTNIRYPYF